MLQQAAVRTVLLAGNPNTGKTTLFNQLTGGSARVGNYPGVTVERRVGKLALPDLSSASLIDSPGTYSLSARSSEEQLAIQAIAGLPPEAPPGLVVLVVDATQLTRNLYLALQVIELGVPILIALNMTDMLEDSGIRVDAEHLAVELGVPVVPIAARTNKGLDALKRAIAAVLHDPSRGLPGWHWEPSTPALRADVAAVEAVLPREWSRGDPMRGRALALWALLSLDEEDELSGVPLELRTAVAERRRAAQVAGRNLDREVIEGRYAWIDARAPRFLSDARQVKRLTDSVDRVLLHPVIGFVLFLALMTVLFQALFTWADPVIGLIEDLFGALGAAAAERLPDGLFADFVVRGVIGGVSSFLVFLPQIVLLFLFLGLLEDTGYMARVAVLMDRIMKAIGLHGRAFVPMLSGYACAVPAILATRTMERRRDRMLTMMVVPLMTCSARLPVYGLLIAALTPPGSGPRFGQGLLLAGMYVFGTVVALCAAFVLGRTVFKGPRVPLLIELPPYRLPHARSVARMVLEQARQFVAKAGTIILACSIAMWALLAFPRDAELAARAASEDAAFARELAAVSPGSAAAAEVEQRRADRAAEAEGEAARHSYAGRLGRLLEPVLAPLGFDWKIGIGVVGAFAAREVFVATMGVVYGVGEDVDEDSPKLRDRLQAATWPDGRRVFTPLACLSLMVFFALACQCMSTLAVVRRETATWRWPLFLFAYMTLLAWVASFAVYQGGRLLGFT